MHVCVYRIVVYQNIMYVVFDSIVIFRSILLLAICNGCAKCFRVPFWIFGQSQGISPSLMVPEHFHSERMQCTNCVTNVDTPGMISKCPSHRFLYSTRMRYIFFSNLWMPYGNLTGVYLCVEHNYMYRGIYALWMHP